MKTNKISIITVVYNAEDVIQNTIESVLNQNYKNFEYIIIDGASDDGTVDIVNKYRDQITYFISESDNGIYDAMNKGIDIAQGDWINIMNAGDTFVNDNVLSEVADTLDYNFSFVYGDRYRVNENNEKRYENAGRIEDTLTQEVVFHQALFTKSTLLKKLKYNTCYSLASDFEFVVKSWKNNEKFKYIHIPIANFLEGGRSRQQYLKAQLEAIKIIFDYQEDKMRWKENIYFEHFILSNIGYILNKNLQEAKSKYPNFRLLPTIRDKSLYIKTNIEDKEIDNFLKVMNSPLSFIDGLIPYENHEVSTQGILFEKIDKLSKIKFSSNPLGKYKAYKNILKEFNQIKNFNYLKNKSISSKNKTIKPTFTVITVTYNAENYLEETIRSIVEQENIYFEYIIIDGASKDNTLQIIKDYESKIDFFISEPDNGLYDAMNKGIEKAKGEYVIFMNAGDTFSENNILDNVKKTISLNVDDVVYGDRFYISESGQVDLQKAKPIETVFERMPFGHQSCFIKRELLQARPFNTTYKYAADYDMIIDFYLQEKKFKYIEIPVCNFLHGGESESGIRPYVEVLKILFDNCKDKEQIKQNHYYKAFKNNVNSLLEI